jgi:hypothetical protein
MATLVGRIEREFYLKELYDKRLPIIFIKDRVEYVLTLEKPVGEELVLRASGPIKKLKITSKLPLLFNYREQTVEFSTEIKKITDELIICKAPDKLHKNLDRDFVRVDVPSDLKILFIFRGDRYNLSFPKVMEYENIAAEDVFKSDSSRDLSKLIKQLTNSLKDYADGYKVVNFKDKSPDSIEERIISETGRALFLPSTVGDLPKIDPYPRKRLVTEDLFKRYLESTGVGVAFLDDKYQRFIKGKFSKNIYSDAWIPILFHEYVIGYIRIWIEKEGKLPFDYNVLDNVFQFAKVLAFSLKENGYFEKGKVKNEPFEGRVLDISASGLLFACPPGLSLASTLLVDAELTVSVESSRRTVNIAAKIVRRYKDKAANYFGCRFVNIAPEDTRFLFEHIYGRQIDDIDAAFLSGQV